MFTNKACIGIGRKVNSACYDIKTECDRALQFVYVFRDQYTPVGESAYRQRQVIVFMIALIFIKRVLFQVRLWGINLK